MSKPVIIVGAGLSGLSAALTLQKKGIRTTIIESSKSVGGAMNTDIHPDGYYLDRGFQVILSAYPELQRLNQELQIFNQIKLQTFGRGAWLYRPNQKPKLFQILNPTFSIPDLARMVRLAFQVAVPGETTIEFLRRQGFTPKIIEDFWKPFFSGIFLESELDSPAVDFLFILRMFASDPVGLPENGVGALPKAMASHLHSTDWIFNETVESTTSTSITLQTGTRIEASAVYQIEPHPGPWGTVTTRYFVAETPPFAGPWLCLVSKRFSFFCNHIAVLTNVSKSYAPNGKTLIAVNSLNMEASDGKIKSELFALFGKQTHDWKQIGLVALPQALPLFTSPSQNYAIRSGRLWAEKIAFT